MQILLLQATVRSLGMPTFQELIVNFGPYLGLVLFLIIVMLILQWRWFVRVLNSKDDEIKRLVANNNDLSARVISMIDKEIGFKKDKNTRP